jgi:hypothetical protein
VFLVFLTLLLQSRLFVFFVLLFKLGNRNLNEKEKYIYLVFLLHSLLHLYVQKLIKSRMHVRMYLLKKENTFKLSHVINCSVESKAII